MTLRSYLDPDRQTAAPTQTTFKTEQNPRAVRCGMCGETIYVDEATFSFVSEAINSGLDDPFRCERCKQEYDDLAFEG